MDHPTSTRTWTLPRLLDPESESSWILNLGPESESSWILNLGPESGTESGTRILEYLRLA